LNEILFREGRGSRDRRKGQGRWTRRRWICGRREGLGDESGRCGELVEKDGDRGVAGMFYGREGHGREPRRSVRRWWWLYARAHTASEKSEKM